MINSIRNLIRNFKRYYKKHPENIIVPILAAIILIIFFVTTGIIFYLNRYNVSFPPVISDCPDYWLDESKDDTSKCVNVQKLGKEECPKIMDFSQSRFQGSNGLCRKYKWAKSCDITWDGITSQIDDPCS